MSQAKPHIKAKVQPGAAVRSPEPYNPDLEAYGLREVEGQIEPIVACPDIEPAKLMRDKTVTIDGRSYEVRINARLWEGRFHRNGRLLESRVTDRLDRQEIEGRYKKLRESAKLSESDWFSGAGGFSAVESPLTSNYVPLIPGPATRQQYWADYWASSAKCFEASTHSGIARRACKAMVNFPLSRGVQWKISDERAQQAWEEFWKANKMAKRWRSIAYDLSVFGEQFLRYFPARPGTKGYITVRQLDPATIYEIVSDQEDLETVFFYHQQYQSRIELYSPPRSTGAPQGPTPPGVTVYAIRQIDASEIDHYKIHTVAGEARGRSDIFPVLGDLKRLRDLLTSKVIQADIATRVLGVLKVNGTVADTNRVLSQIFPNGQAPAPGSVVGINEAVESLEALQLGSERQVREDFTYQELIDEIVAGVGISRANLGLSPAQSSGTTQSTAITSETSGGKAFEERQELIDEALHDQFDRVMEAAGINGQIEVEFIFPELAKEDRSAKLADLGTAEGNMWISKKTAASAAAAELGFTQYDYDEEMELIAAEFEDADETDGTDEMGNDKPARGGKIRRPLIGGENRQVPKLDPTKAQVGDDEPPGLLVGGPQPPAPAPGATAPPAPAQKTAGGLPASKAPGTQKTREADIRRQADDPIFDEHAEAYRAETQANLDRLLKDLAA